MKKKIMMFMSLLLVPLLGACQAGNKLSAPIGTLQENELVWLPHEEAESYEVIVRKDNNVLLREQFQKEDDLKISFKDYENLPFGKLDVELIAKTEKKQGSAKFTYIESTIRHLHVNENSYSRTVGSSFNYYHHGIEFDLGTTIPLTEIATMPLTGTNEEMTATYNNIKALYNSFLIANETTRNTLAATIGNDLIVTYYYYDENDIPVHIYTKQKYWAQYLNILNEDTGEYIRFGEPTGYFNASIVSGTYRTAVNFNPITIDFTPMSEKDLYTDVIVIKDGIVASETTKVELEKYEAPVPISTKIDWKR